ncbi:MAG TPA: hypothetical protein VIL04_12045 [Solirubrobacterales bacterium]|jgi:hypothetical protein
MERDARGRPVVHLELHTHDLGDAREFYGRLFGWPSERVERAGSEYTTLGLAGGLGGGIVQCPTRMPLWLPYVHVDDIFSATRLAERLGAVVLLAPREGPAGWRSVVRTATGGEVALWQPKEPGSFRGPWTDAGQGRGGDRD